MRKTASLLGAGALLAMAPMNTTPPEENAEENAPASFVERCEEPLYETAGNVHLASIEASLPIGATSIVDVTPLVDAVVSSPAGSAEACQDAEGTLIEFQNGTWMLLPADAEEVEIVGARVIAHFPEQLE